MQALGLLMTLADKPKATVVIPTFERVDALLETLRALRDNRLPPRDYEIVVVDDGSEDDAVATIDRWAQTSPVPVTCLRQHHRGPSGARNVGAMRARGTVLIFVDNDIVVGSDFVRRHLALHKERRRQIITGRVVQGPKFAETVFGRYRHALWEQFYESRPPERLSISDGLSAANLSMLAAHFHELGGFDEQLSTGEDWDLGYRARAAGFQTLYDPLNVGMHNDWAEDLVGFCSRQRTYAEADVALYVKYGEASPRAGLMAAHWPISKADGLRATARKRINQAVVASGGERFFQAAAGMSERVFGDHPLTHRLYERAVACAIFDGVRRGVTAYAAAKPREPCDRM